MDKFSSFIKAVKEINSLENRVIPSSIIVSVTSSVLPFINIWFTSKIIDLLTNNYEFKSIIFYVFVATIINLVLNSLNIFCNDIYYMFRSLMYNKERKNIATKLYSLDFNILESPAVTELIHKHEEAQKRVYSAFVQFSWMIRDFLSGLLTLLISGFLIFPLIKIGFSKTGDSFFESPIFLVIIIILLVVMTIVILLIAKKMNKAWFVASDEYSKLDKMFYYFLKLFDNYESGKEIRMYKEQQLVEELAVKNLLTDGERILKKASLYTAKSSSVVAILGAFLGFCIYLFIGVKGLFGLFSVGSLVCYCGSFIQVINGITKMATTFGKTEEIIPLLDYYFQIMELKNNMAYGNKGLNLSNGIKIEFKNVSFKYPGSKNNALNNINIVINNCERLSIVGKNGSGKTTFIKLLCRFYDVDSGEILINETNIKDYSKKSLNYLFSVVFQDFKLFPLSIYENISASYEYDRERLYDYLSKSNIKELVMKMKNKEHTYLYKNVDTDGINISGGESQKLALTRALYKDAPIIILDEPTAALDPVSEYEIYSSFNSMINNKLTIYISHRLSSCLFSDKIAVFDESKLVGLGTHNELIESIDIYKELWDAQAKYYVEGGI